MRKVRTTIMPNTEIEVSEQEYTDLSRQGLIAGEPESEPESPAPDATDKPKIRRGTDQ